MPSHAIAGVVRDGRFSAHLINESTEVVFMDEWSSDSLSGEDAKRVLQGQLCYATLSAKIDSALDTYAYGFHCE